MPTPTPSEIKILPAYTLAEAARYVGVSEGTLRTWFRGRPAYTTKKGAFRRSAIKSILPTEAGPGEPLSFIDLIEAHILFSLRKAYKFPMRRVKKAMEYLAALDGNLMLLAHRDFFHDHTNLYLGNDTTLLTLTEQGQFADKTILESGLRQIASGNDGFADEFFPRKDNAPQRDFVVNSSINFGQISIARLRVGAEALAARYVVGEPVAGIAEDYGAATEEIMESVRWHDRLAA